MLMLLVDSRTGALVTRLGYDSVDANGIPADATLCFGYINGRVEYRSYKPMVARFPHAVVGSISVDPSTAANVLDIESGDARPDQAPGWVQLSIAAGYTHPMCYMSYSNWPNVITAFAKLGEANPFYWVAKRGPAVMVPGAIGNQYADMGPYDVSMFADYIPGLDPKPKPKFKEKEMVLVALATGEPTDSTFPAGWVGTWDGTQLVHVLGPSATGTNNLAALIPLLGAPALVSYDQLKEWSGE